MDEDETWHGGRLQPGGPHCVRWGPSSPSPKGAQPPFSANVYCGQMAGWIKMPLGTEVDLSPSHLVLCGDPAPQKRGHCNPPIFECVHCVGFWRPKTTILGKFRLLGASVPTPFYRWGPNLVCYSRPTVYVYVPNFVSIGLFCHPLLPKNPSCCRFLDFGI